MSVKNAIRGNYFFYSFAIGVISPYLVIYFKDGLGFNDSQVGLLLMLRPAMAIFAQPFWSIVADTGGHPRHPNPGFRKPRRPRLFMTKADVDWVKARKRRERWHLAGIILATAVLAWHTVLLLRGHAHEPPAGDGAAQVR